jgi:hypothetical protein
LAIAAERERGGVESQRHNGGMVAMGDERIAESTGTLLVRWVGLPVVGAALLWLLTLLVDWLVSLPWVPLRGPLELVGSIPEPWATLGALALGLVGGLVFALMAHGERLAVTVSADRLRLDGDGYTATFDRDEVSAVFLDKGQVVVLGRDTGELARRPSELDHSRLAAACREHGFPWRDGDPHAEAYRRWVPDTPGLPAGANALLAARARSKDADDAKELRAELAKLGVLVRGGKDRQYWRTVE